MKKNDFLNNDDLIQGIRFMLSNYRCSFSEKEKVLLNDCINKLELLKTDPEQQNQLQTSVKVLETILRIFSIVDHFKDLF